MEIKNATTNRGLEGFPGNSEVPYERVRENIGEGRYEFGVVHLVIDHVTAAISNHVQDHVTR